ncbi:SigE family RNA polymerase sigma factor [Kitasatospora sp. NA04385]|uniref:SigE family RNA polymerase sigma factor n=1 Tax=Kitasatospora sp. NA04385 TaxID=2742135 RepID=UPI001590D88B|nr:SigE family RNA polymerase sigma factor [Kitasatospora sp. NA04385]QKW20420.1 SigE family RNA polymerase sigma factor [Kitasatospora sp. NA04385]
MSRETEDDAYAAFVEDAWPRHLRTATLIAGNRDLGEELLQDCLVKLYVRWHRVGVEDPHAYLRRMLVNGNISRWRRFRRETLTDQLPEPAVGHPGPAEDGMDELHRALRSLPLKQRAVVVLRYVEDLTEKDTAAVLGCSVGTVKSHHARAMARLRTVLSGTWWKNQEVAVR